MSDFAWSERKFPDYRGGLHHEDVKFEELYEGVREAEKYAFHLEDALDIHNRIIVEDMYKKGYPEEVKNYLRDVGYEKEFENPLDAAEWLTEQIASEAWNLKNAYPPAFPSENSINFVEEYRGGDFDEIEYFQNRAGLNTGREEAENLRNELLERRENIFNAFDRVHGKGVEWKDRGKIGSFLSRMGILEGSIKTWSSEDYTETLSPDIMRWKLQDSIHTS
jgi:hypothetical protein